MANKIEISSVGDHALLYLMSEADSNQDGVLTRKEFQQSKLRDYTKNKNWEALERTVQRYQNPFRKDLATFVSSIANIDNGKRLAVVNGVEVVVYGGEQATGKYGKIFNYLTTAIASHVEADYYAGDIEVPLPLHALNTAALFVEHEVSHFVQDAFWNKGGHHLNFIGAALGTVISNAARETTHALINFGIRMFCKSTTPGGTNTDFFTNPQTAPQHGDILGN